MYKRDKKGPFASSQIAPTMTSALDVTEGLDVSPPSADLLRRVSPSYSNRPNFLSSLTVQSGPASKPLKPFVTGDINILLLENVNQTGRNVLESQGYQVTALKSSLAEDELIEKIRWENGACSLLQTVLS